MKDSNRARKRITAFIVSQGGSVTSGQNDNFLAWMFRAISSSAYAHKRVDDIKATLLAMEANGEIVLDRRQDGRIIGARLAEDAPTELVDEEDYDLFDQQTIWLYVARLVADNRLLRARNIQTERAFEELATETHDMDVVQQLQDRIDELERAAASPGACDHVQEIADLNAAHHAEIVRVREEGQQLLRGKEDSWRRKHKILSDKLSVKGTQLAEVQRELLLVAPIRDVILDAISRGTSQSITLSI